MRSSITSSFKFRFDPPLPPHNHPYPYVSSCILCLLRKHCRQAFIKGSRINRTNYCRLVILTSSRVILSISLFEEYYGVAVYYKVLAPLNQKWKFYMKFKVNAVGFLHKYTPTLRCAGLGYCCCYATTRRYYYY